MEMGRRDRHSCHRDQCRSSSFGSLPEALGVVEDRIKKNVPMKWSQCTVLYAPRQVK